MPRTPVAPWVSDELVTRRIVVAAADAVVVKALVESYEGVANVFAVAAGELTIAAPTSREAELDALLRAIDELLDQRAAAPPQEKR